MFGGLAPNTFDSLSVSGAAELVSKGKKCHNKGCCRPAKYVDVRKLMMIKSHHYDQTPTSVLVKDHELSPAASFFLLHHGNHSVGKSKDPKVLKFQLRCF